MIIRVVYFDIKMLLVLRMLYLVLGRVYLEFERSYQVFEIACLVFLMISRGPLEFQFVYNKLSG